MKQTAILKKSILALALLCPIMVQAEVLALVNYESKPGQTPKREGLAIIDIDIDLESANFGKIVENIPLPVGVVAHHVFYNRDVTKAYVTGLGNNPLQVMDMTKNPICLKPSPHQNVKWLKIWFFQPIKKDGF